MEIEWMIEEGDENGVDRRLGWKTEDVSGSNCILHKNLNRTLYLCINSDFIVYTVPCSFYCSFCNEQHKYVYDSCAELFSEFDLTNDVIQ